LASRNFTANWPVWNLLSSNSSSAGSASAYMTMKPPVASVTPSESNSLNRRRQPVNWKRAKKLEPAFQPSLTAAQVSTSTELILESIPSQSMIRSRPPRLWNQSFKASICLLAPSALGARGRFARLRHGE